MNPSRQKRLLPADNALGLGNDELLASLAQTSPVGIVVLDVAGRIVYANGRAEELLEVGREGIVGRTYNAAEWRAVDRSGGPLAEEDYPFRRAMAAGAAVYGVRLGLARADGSVRRLSVNAAPLGDGPGCFVGVVVTLEDVTREEAAEAALRASQQRYRELLAAVTSYTYSVSVHRGRAIATEHSLGCVASTGYLPDDYRARPGLWLEMVHPDDRRRVEEEIRRVIDGELVPPLEHRIVHRDGDIRWLRTTFVQYRDEGGQVSRYDGLVEDITEAHRAEDRFRQLLESTPDAMIIVDGEGRIVLANGPAEQTFAYGHNELRGRSLEELLPQRLRQLHLAHVAAYLKHPHSRPMGRGMELVALDAKGREFPAEISLRPLLTDKGVMVAAAIRDISDRKRMEQALAEQKAQLLAAQHIQQHLLPRATPSVPGFDIAGVYYPAAFAAGDYYDYLPTPGGSLLVVIGDVAGHGMGSAVLMAATHTLLRTLARQYVPLERLLARANEALLEQVESDHFVTLLAVRIDPERRRLDFANAGHPSGYVFDAAGAIKARLESSGPPLAVIADAHYDVGRPIGLESGDVVLLATDGFLERINDQRRAFGAQRFVETIARHRHLSAGEILAALDRASDEHAHGAPRTDDMTAVAIKVL